MEPDRGWVILSLSLVWESDSVAQRGQFLPRLHAKR